MGIFQSDGDLPIINQCSKLLYTLTGEHFTGIPVFHLNGTLGYIPKPLLVDDWGLY